jgi:site-specific DNA-adenine methylase
VGITLSLMLEVLELRLNTLQWFVSDIHINDIDKAVYSFWASITSNTEEFLKLLVDTPVNMDVWYKQKQILNDQDCDDILLKGFATFFLIVRIGLVF